MSSHLRLQLTTARLRLLYVLVGAVRTVRRRVWDVLCLRPARAGVSASSDGDERLNPHRPGPAPPAAFTRTFAGPCVIEPKYGWAVAAPSALLDDTFTYGWTTRTWTGREWVGLPSPVGYLRGRKGAEDVGDVSSVCSPWPENYFHFILDVLPKLDRVLEADPGAERPILVASELHATRFFREAAGMGDLARYRFVPLDGRYRRTSSLVVSYGGSIHEVDLDAVRRRVGIDALTPPGGATPERIFVTRGAHRGRLPRNIVEVEGLFRRHGFDVVDLDGYGFREQVELFHDARLVAGIHGAALANLVWCRPGQTRALELVPRVSTDEFDWFVKLAARLDLPLTRVISHNVRYEHKRAPFHVPMAELERAIDDLVTPAAASGPV